MMIESSRSSSMMKWYNHSLVAPPPFRSKKNPGFGLHDLWISKHSLKVDLHGNLHRGEVELAKTIEYKHSRPGTLLFSLLPKSNPFYWLWQLFWRWHWSRKRREIWQWLHNWLLAWSRTLIMWFGSIKRRIVSGYLPTNLLPTYQPHTHNLR